MAKRFVWYVSPVMKAREVSENAKAFMAREKEKTAAKATA